MTVMAGKNVWVGRFLLSAIMALGLAISGCGNDGAQGVQGPEGPEGPAGPEGPEGPPGGTAPGPEDVVDISNPALEEFLVSFGEALVAEITDVTVSSPPVAEFTLATQGGAAVTGLDVESVEFTFVKLVVPSDPNLRSRWVSYVNEFENARPDNETASPNLLEKALHVAADVGGTLVDNGDGSYEYTFATDVTNVTEPVPVTYEPTLTHRAGLELRIDPDDVLNPDNPTYTFVPDGSAVTDTKDIFATESCNKCHGRLALHGGARFTADYCVTCHNANGTESGTRDQDYAETVDMASMTHAIHAAAVREALGEAQVPVVDLSYIVYGFGENFANQFFSLADDFSGTSPLGPLSDCESCHKASEETPDGDDWRESVDSLSCGGCHADRLLAGTPDATTGLSTYAFMHEGVGTQQDGSCIQCHGTGQNSAEEAHRNLVAEEAVNYAFSIDAASIAADGEVSITFTVSDPIAMTTYDIKTAPQFNDSGSRLRFRIAWSSDDYSNHLSLQDVGQPVAISVINQGENGCNNPPVGFTCTGPAVDGSFTITEDIVLPKLCLGGDDGGLPCDTDVDCPGGTCELRTTGDTYGIAMEGRARADIGPLECNGGDNDGEDCSGDADCPGGGACEPSSASIPITSQIDYVTIDDVGMPEPRREIVSIDLCNDCHGIMTEHGSNRTNNIQVCATCHNANATDLDDAGPGNEASVDMKAMIHGIHSANASFADGGDTFFDITYPRHDRLPNECNACHLEGTYYPVDTTVDFRLATTTDSEADAEDPEDDLNTTFNAATCGGCHIRLDNPDTLEDESQGSITTAAHMDQNGSSFIAAQTIQGDLDCDPPDLDVCIETCTTCHGAGKSQDVAVIHLGE